MLGPHTAEVGPAVTPVGPAVTPVGLAVTHSNAGPHGIPQWDANCPTVQAGSIRENNFFRKPTETEQHESSSGYRVVLDPNLKPELALPYLAAQMAAGALQDYSGNVVLL